MYVHPLMTPSILDSSSYYYNYYNINNGMYLKCILILCHDSILHWLIILLWSTNNINNGMYLKCILILCHDSILHWLIILLWSTMCRESGSKDSYCSGVSWWRPATTGGYYGHNRLSYLAEMQFIR